MESRGCWICRQRNDFVGKKPLCDGSVVVDPTVQKGRMLGARQAEERGVPGCTLSDEDRGQRSRRSFFSGRRTPSTATPRTRPSGSDMWLRGRSGSLRTVRDTGGASRQEVRSRPFTSLPGSNRRLRQRRFDFALQNYFAALIDTNCLRMKP